jgi:hypothetical protein
MSRRRRAPLVFFFALAAAVASLAAASTARALTITLIDLCRIAPAAITLYPPPGGHVSADSGDASYAQSFCGRYVADIKVPAGSTGFHIEGSYTYTSGVWGNSPSTCSAITEHISIYESDAPGTPFTRIAASTLKGFWTNTSQGYICHMDETAGDNPLEFIFGAPFSTSPPTFRIAISAKVSTYYGPIAIPVSVYAGWY